MVGAPGDLVVTFTVSRPEVAEKERDHAAIGLHHRAREGGYDFDAADIVEKIIVPSVAAPFPFTGGHHELIVPAAKLRALPPYGTIMCGRRYGYEAMALGGGRMIMTQGGGPGALTLYGVFVPNDYEQWEVVDD